MQSNEPNSLVEELVALEHRALVRWCNGDPSGYLEISGSDVVYFDPFIEQRIDGRPALSAYYEAIRGKIRAERFEILNPLAQCSGDMAALTFNFVSYGANGTEMRWNCTEVYRRRTSEWQIVHSHWSLTKPGS